MLNYIKAWFNDFIRDGRADNYEHIPEEKSTLDILQDTISLFTPPKKLEERSGYSLRYWTSLGQVDITIEPRASHKYLKDLGLKKIHRSVDYGFIGTTYEVDYNEYMSKFELTYRGRYIKDHVVPVYNFLATTDTDFSYLLNRFNLSLLTAYNMVVESRKNNSGTETEEVYYLVKEILESFTSLINERIAEIETLADKVRHATNQSHTDFLRAELEYVNKFIKGEGMND